MQLQQKEGNLIMPGELVRRVKNGAGPGSLGEAQQVSMSQALEQYEIESDTRAIVTRLEAAWSGQSGDTARGGLQPLVQATTMASTALNTGQNTLTDQSHAFLSTRDTMQEVSDSPPERDAVDVLTVWDTDTEDQINKNNAAIEQNKQIYQGFTSTSDGHARTMPTEYGRMSEAEGDFSVGNPSATGNQQATDAGRPAFQPHSRGLNGSGRDSSPGSSPARYEPGNVGTGSMENAQLPAAQGNGGDGTHRSSVAPPSATDPVGGWSGDPARLNRVGPGGGGSSFHGPGNGPGGNSGFDGGFAPGVSGTGRPGAGGGTTGDGPRSGGLGGAGRSTGSGGRLGAPEESMTRAGSGTGASGARGANGMPMGAAGSKGNKEEDKEKKSASYLLEPDPNALFGYDGKAVPPVIGT
ncbi:hypothetical protein [Amycolatopsis panacis]|uniref:PPE domain-containing protein n=1 Tax=Amycolatopsis panacis TaxID=2340917 RepID=A0A419I6C4_9PSEU|nr:hypothetical protein [Amycolatopsis panacis]RJQ86824.1 hypothetical protein D5S19_10885 [Amycolatopsis panacis]